MRKLIVALGLAGCAGPVPVIADLESDKVIVQAWANQTTPEIQQVAEQGCSIHDREAFGPLHVAAIPNSYQYTFLYACR